METISLYCKSFHRDVDLCKNLLSSVQKYNKDKIPFYISVPKHDIELFKNKLGTVGYTLLSDEQILGEELPSSWITQQVVKASFWRTNISKNYVMIDSDSFFIRDFYIADFMYTDDCPFVVCHEQQDLFEWSSINHSRLGFNPQESFIKDRKQIMSLFGFENQRVMHDFGPGPVIWNREVWNDLEKEYIQPNRTSLYNLIQECPSEFTWYGCSLLYWKSIPIIPRSPLFKFFHYKQQYDDFIKNGGNIDLLKPVYLGITLQSSFIRSY